MSQKTDTMAVQVPIGFDELGGEDDQQKQFKGVSFADASNELDQVGRDYVSSHVEVLRASNIYVWVVTYYDQVSLVLFTSFI